MSPCPFAGPADEAMLLPNTLQKAGGTEPQTRCTAHSILEGDGGCAASSHPVLSSTWSCHPGAAWGQVGQQKLWRERDAVSSRGFIYGFGLPYFLSGSGTWAFYHRAMPCPSILRRARESAVIANSGESRPAPDLRASALHPSPREVLRNLSGYLLPDRLLALQDGFFLSVPPGKSMLLNQRTSRSLLKEGAGFLTVPGVKHVCDEVVNERDLRLGNAAGVSVKNRHYHRQVQLFLFISLQNGTPVSSESHPATGCLCSTSYLFCYV